MKEKIMLEKGWNFLKETGLIGNLIAAIIIWLFGLSFAFLNSFTNFKYKITFSIPIFLAISLVIIVLGIVYLVYSAISNPTRQFSNIFGYYRKLYHATYSPYTKIGTDYYTKIVKRMEYRITKNGTICIGPLSFYAYRPRSSDGEEILHINTITTTVNGNHNILNAELSPVGSDCYSVILRSNLPLSKGDLVIFIIDYSQHGMHAIVQEELDKYRNLPDLKNTMRNRIIKERNVEHVYASPTHSIKYVVEVHFPPNFPWKLLESTDEMVIISVSSKPINKALVTKIAHISVTVDMIRLEYKYDFRSAHGHYILWKLPNVNELNQYSIAYARQNVPVEAAKERHPLN